MYKKVFCPKQKHRMYTEQKSMVETERKKVLIRKRVPNLPNGRSISTCTKKCTSLRISLERVVRQKIVSRVRTLWMEPSPKSVCCLGLFGVRT